MRRGPRGPSCGAEVRVPTGHLPVMERAHPGWVTLSVLTARAWPQGPRHTCSPELLGHLAGELILRGVMFVFMMTGSKLSVPSIKSLD